MKNNLSKLAKLKQKLEKISSNGEVFDKNLKYLFWSEFIYGSSVVEGVKLQKSEVEEIVKFGGRSKLLKQNPGEELLQAYGQRIVLELIEKWAKSKKPITTEYIREIHYLTFSKIDTRAGNFRDNYIKLRSSALMPSFPFTIAVDIRDFNSELLKLQEDLDENNINDIVHLIAKCYHSITKIHPFSDGNGRTARLFINLILRKYGLPYIFVPKVDNEKKMRLALRAGDMGNLSILSKFMENFLEKSMEETITYWENKATTSKI